MKHLKVIGALALALAVFSAPALAETQTVRISGQLDISHIYKHDFDLRSGNDVSLVPVGTAVPDTGANGNDESTGSDGADWFSSAVQIEVAADLNDNVSVVINLYNQRDWNSNQYNFTSTSNATEEFDIGVDLAYVQLKEAFYSPLTLVLGRQDIEFGRGFLFGDFNVQDAQAGIAASENSVVTSYDAVRATLDFEPWTVDLVYANIAQGNINEEDDRGLWWFNVNYQFSEYNAEWEAYLGSDSDRNTLDNAAAAGAAVRSSSPRQTYVIGTRAEFDPVENLTLGGEIAYQFGDYYATVNPTNSSEQSISSLGLDFYGEYRWSANAYSPWMGLQYVWLEGDDSGDGDYNGWNGMFRSPTYGNIREYIEVYYATALTGDASAASNHKHIAVSGGLSPMDDLTIDAVFYWFWTEEDVTNTTGGVSELASDEVGTELDVNVTYDYTEDVTFGLNLAWFMPGDLYDQASNGTQSGPLDDTATQVVSSVSVAF